MHACARRMYMGCETPIILFLVSSWSSWFSYLLLLVFYWEKSHNIMKTFNLGFKFYAIGSQPKVKKFHGLDCFHGIANQGRRRKQWSREGVKLRHRLRLRVVWKWGIYLTETEAGWWSFGEGMSQAMLQAGNFTSKGPSDIAITSLIILLTVIVAEGFLVAEMSVHLRICDFRTGRRQDGSMYKLRSRDCGSASCR